MHQKAKGIVLHQLKYSEDSLIVDIFTEEFGAMSYWVKVSRANRNRLLSSLLRPLNFVDILFENRPGRNIQRIVEMDTSLPCFSIPFHPLKATIVLFLQEFLYYTLRREASNVPLFRYMEHAIQWLDQSEQHFSNFHLMFLVNLTRFLGFWPNLEGFRQGSVFDLQEGAFSSSVPFHKCYLDADESLWVQHFMRMNTRTMTHFHLNREQRSRILSVLGEYYKLHIPEFPELKSISVLQEVLS